MNRALHLPVRWRLTLWYTLLLAVILAIFSGTLYVGLRAQLYASLDEQLLNQAALAMVQVRVANGTPAMDTSVPRVLDGEYLLRLLDLDGQAIVDAGSHPGGLPPDPAAVRLALSGLTAYSNAADEDGETIRVVSVPVRGPGDEPPVVGLLQIGLDRNEIDEPLNGLVTAFALASPLVLLLAAGAGYLLAGRALAPVATITRLAANIGADDLGARLNLDLPDDELGQLAQTFDAMLARIEDAFERQRRFAGDAAHELRTPLSVMRSQVDLALAKPRTAAEYEEALREVDVDLERLSELVGTLLTLARADAGRLAPDRSLFDLADTVSLVIEHYTAPASAAGITLRSETTPAPLLADEDLIVQLLVNMLENALAHTAAGGSVTVGCRSSNGQVRIWVADSGAGIATEHQPRIFDRFYRVDSGRTRTRGGSGLGLSICRTIVEAHGGTIFVTSEIGQGARFDMILPAA